MKGINTLIKLHQRELDALRRQLVQLEEQKEQLIQLAGKLHRELMNERELAVKDPTMAAYMGDFEKRIKNRQLEIAKEVIQIDQRSSQLAAAIAESFGELKKYEITRDNEHEREQAKANQREQEMLDEIGMQQFSRKDDS
jgi:flagellar export protein FliJ